MHGTHELAPATGEERVFAVDELTRVEGEGSLKIRIRDGEVLEARLKVFEAPRFFERLVVGRTPDEVIDIVARICGICPIAYQMSACEAMIAAAVERPTSGSSPQDGASRKNGWSTVGSSSSSAPWPK